MGSILRAAKGVPIDRAVDHRKPGIGKLTFDSETLVNGDNLSSQVSIGDSLTVCVKGRHHDAVVAEIISDNQLHLKKPGFEQINQG